MPKRKVELSAQSHAGADACWVVVRDFCAPWHPAIASMDAEAGGAIRRFTVYGEETVYRERLTWFSDTERTMGYSHLEGIAGALDYTAWLEVSATGTVTMQAEITASEPRLSQIAAGTKAIFEAGLEAILEQAGDVAPTPQSVIAAPAKIARLDLEGQLKLAVSVAGAPSDTVCLFLHGIGGNRKNWHAQLTAVAPHTSAAAVDLRGYGDSSLGPNPSNIGDYCNDILRVMEEIGAARLILCGLSYGAWIATSFAMRHSDKLAGLVLSGGCTGMSEASIGEREAFRRSREVPLNAGKTPADFAPAVVEIISGPNTAPEVQKELLASMAAIPADTYWDALRCFTTPPERFDFSIISCPVLMMTGEFDQLAPPEEIKSVAHRIWETSSHPDIRFEIIQNAGHVCNLEAPDLYNRYLTEFISRCLQRPAKNLQS